MQTMQRTLIADTSKKIGEKVEISGWVDTKRDHGKITFIDVHDYTGTVQIVGAGEAIASLKPQYVVKVEGTVQKRPPQMVNKKIKTGEIEIKSHKLEVLAKSQELPFDMGAETLGLELPTLLDFRSLTLRHPKVKAIFKVQAKVLEGFRIAAQEIGCTEIVIPTIAVSATEGGAEVFKVDYYGRSAYLTQSPQLYKQMLIPVFERVFTVTKAYRAEPSVTTRHLSEVTQMDCEIGFVDFNDLLDLLEKVACQTIKYAESESKEDLDSLGHKKIAFGKIPRLTLREAQEIIKKEFKRDNTKEKDLTPRDETDLCRWAVGIHKSDFVTVTHFPTASKPFYTEPDSENPKLSLSYDLLFRGVEVASGSQRINDYGELLASIKSRGMNPGDFEMYLMAFKYGMPPEGGFSFGAERITMNILGLSNIREASLFPRDMDRVDIRLSKVEKPK